MTGLLVKVCGLTNAENLKAVCETKPDFVGFIFAQDSPRYCAATVDKAVADLVPQGIKKVGVFRNESRRDVMRIVDHLGLEVAQLHGEEDDQYILELKKARPKLLIFRAIRVGDMEDVTSLAEHPAVDMYVFDNKSGGTGMCFDWGLLRHYNVSTPFLLAGGISPANSREVVAMKCQMPMLYGVDINSGVESAPGVKNARLVGQVISKVRGE